MKFQSILISSSKNLEIVEINDFLRQNFLLPEDIKEINLMEILPLKTSIGIGQLEQISGWINRKSVETKFVLIRNAETLTVEAQNSLLKNLEEPPENTLFILITKNRERILETIVSRCISLFYLGSKEDKKEIIEIAEKIIQSNYIDRLKNLDNLAKEYTNREEIAEVVFTVIKALPKDKTTPEQLKVLKNIYLGVKSSVNLKLCLDLLAIYI